MTNPMTTPPDVTDAQLQEALDAYNYATAARTTSQCSTMGADGKTRCAYVSGHGGAHLFSTHDETDAIRARNAADQRDRLARVVELVPRLIASLRATRARLGECERERDQWRRDYLDVADAIMRESTSPQQLADEARRLRRVENEIRAAQEEALRQSLGADLAVRERDDLRAQLASATARVAEVEAENERARRIRDDERDQADIEMRRLAQVSTENRKALNAARAELARVMPVVEAAKEWRTWGDWWNRNGRQVYEMTSDEAQLQTQNAPLARAVDALAKGGGQ